MTQDVSVRDVSVPGSEQRALEVRLRTEDDSDVAVRIVARTNGERQSRDRMWEELLAAALAAEVMSRVRDRPGDAVIEIALPDRPGAATVTTFPVRRPGVRARS
jgi:hypothetical protein